jgi:predicted permease
MSNWYSLFHKLVLLFKRDRFRRELEEEIAFHRSSSEEALKADGMTDEAARIASRRRFGNASLAKQQSHAAISFRWEHFLQDARYGMRSLRRDRVFTVTAILILGLGIGANVAVFSVVDTMLLRPLPFYDAGRLAWLEPGKNLDPKVREAGGLGAKTFIVDHIEAFERQNKSFASITAFNPFYGNSEYTLTGSGQPKGVMGVMVAGNFFDTLGVEPQLGRNFVKEEAQKGGRPAVILSNGFWRRQFNGNPAIIGQSITLNQKPMTVVGVMPASFDFGSVFNPGMQCDVFVPLVMDELRSWGNTLSVVGRLKPATTIASAQAESDIVFKTIQDPNPPFDFSPTITQLKTHVSGSLRQSVIMLWSAVGVVLLIVCVNLSSLLVARAMGRTKEFAMRAALGAGARRLFLQLLTESALLVFVGAALGIGLAYGLVLYLAQQQSISLPLLRETRVDGTALLWALLLTLATASLFGIVPALKLTAGKADRKLVEALKDTGHGISGSGGRWRSLLVVTEVALCCVLLVGAGLLLRSFWRTMDVDMGFTPSQASAIKIDYEQGGDPAKRAATLKELLRRVSEVPGVQVAGEADMLPLGRNRSWMFWAKERPPLKGQIDVALVRIITPGYFPAMGMHLHAGRDFEWSDGSKHEAVVIVNQAAARRFWPGEDPLGKLAVLDGGDNRDARVVGVLDDVRQTSLESEPGPEFYVPAMQSQPEGAELVVRSTLPAATLSPSVMAVLRSINPSQASYVLEPLTTIVDHSVSPRRFFMVLVLSFAALGLMLASLGIYGVISYSVSQRTKEIGIRMALGASSSQVRRSVLGKTLRLAGLGVAVGSLASLAFARAISAMLYGIEPTDPATYLAMLLLLGVVAIVAGYIPARRASRISPMIALRSE